MSSAALTVRAGVAPLKLSLLLTADDDPRARRIVAEHLLEAVRSTWPDAGAQTGGEWYEAVLALLSWRGKAHEDAVADLTPEECSEIIDRLIACVRSDDEADMGRAVVVRDRLNNLDCLAPDKLDREQIVAALDELDDYPSVLAAHPWPWAVIADRERRRKQRDINGTDSANRKC
jgi:hypothetical protein